MSVQWTLIDTMEKVISFTNILFTDDVKNMHSERDGFSQTAMQYLYHVKYVISMLSHLTKVLRTGNDD